VGFEVELVNLTSPEGVAKPVTTTQKYSIEEEMVMRGRKQIGNN
jgi:hypothetical protein